MAAEEPVGLDDPFLQLALERGWLDAEQASELAQAAASSRLPAAELAVERGWMAPSLVDVGRALLAPHDVAPGYEILDLLGHGGLGVVYRARQKNLDRVVALKTVLLARMSQPGILARFEQEARTVGRLRHPNIVAAYDFGSHRGRLYLAMELVEGEDLDCRLDRSLQLDELTTWGIIRQVASGLAHAAEQGIVHRDIKPANLLLTRPPAGMRLAPGVPMVKITDFGLAFFAAGGEERTRLTETGTTLGTPQYMAPEQFSESHVDQRADIYSLGATAFHLLAGRPPFAGTTLPQILASKLRDERVNLAELAPAVSGASHELIDELMATDPNGRMEDYSVLLARIDAILDRLSKEPRDLQRTALDLSAEAPPAAALPATKMSTISGARQPTAPAMPAVPQPGRVSRRVKIAGGLIALGALLVALVMPALQPAKESTGPRYKPSGESLSLWDGGTLAGWQARPGGSWDPTARDEEGASVLAGTGPIVRSLRTTERPSVPELFAIFFEVDLVAAEAVEIRFGVCEGGSCGVLRVARDGVRLSERESAEASLEQAGETIPYPVIKPEDGRSPYQGVRLERQPKGWVAWFNDQPVGAVRRFEVRETPQFELSVPGRSPARFSSITLTELKAEWPQRDRP